jgi:hypothetical protein
MERLMCDYSLDHVASRPAKVGDRLTSTRFLDSCTRGFASVSEPIAICLQPGTELGFEKELRCEGTFFGFKRLRHKVARFRQINKDRLDVHHDALALPDGQIALVTNLKEGQRATDVAIVSQPPCQYCRTAKREKRKSTADPEIGSLSLIGS